MKHSMTPKRRERGRKYWDEKHPEKVSYYRWPSGGKSDDPAYRKN
jgi:hypothetical protein